MFAGDLINEFFTTKNRGVAKFADALPSVEILLNGNVTTVPVTIAATAIAGQYRYSFTTVGTWSRGDEVHARITATIDGLVESVIKSLGEIEEPATFTISVTQMQAIADEFLKRGAANVDGLAEPDSPYSLLMMAFHAVMSRDSSPGTYTLNQTDDATVHQTGAITTSSGGQAITGVSD